MLEDPNSQNANNGTPEEFVDVQPGPSEQPEPSEQPSQSRIGSPNTGNIEPNMDLPGATGSTRSNAPTWDSPVFEHGYSMLEMTNRSDI